MLAVALLWPVARAWSAEPSAAPASVEPASAPGDTRHGERLFIGRDPLVGTITGHASRLPGDAARCINCHASSDTATASAPSSRPAAWPASGGNAVLGPVLTARTLLQSQSRRRGPASAFDASSLCRLLRTGVDPAFIVIAQAMPRYEMSDGDCQALWAYMTRPQP